MRSPLDVDWYKNASPNLQLLLNNSNCRTATYPLIEIRAQRHNTIKFNLRDVELRMGRASKPKGVSGAILYTHLGDFPPAQLSDWTVWGTESKTTCEITMPDSTPFGATLWIAAAWLNTRLESGPLGDPMAAQLGGGVLQTVGAKLKPVETV